MMDRISCTAVALTLLSIFLALSGSSYIPVHVYQNRVDDDTGRFVSCGPKESNFVLDWTPRVLRPGVQLTIDFKFNMIKSFSHGMVCVSVWLKGVSDPIYHDCRDQQCVDAQKAVKKFIPSFSCPIREGFSASFTKMPYKVQPTMPLPSGSFRIAANITNEDKQLVFCADGEIEINDE